MKFYVVSLITILFIDASLSADPQFSLKAFNDSTGQDLNTVYIKGFAKYKPGGSAMMLSLLIQGKPGLMPGVSGAQTTSGPSITQPSGSKVQPTSGPSSSPSPSGGAGTGGGTGGGSTLPPSPTSGSGGGAFQAFETEALDEHNKFRQVHGSQPMRLNREMCDEAAAYAKIIAQSGNMKHSTKEQRKGQGENLSMGCSSNKGGQTTTEAVDNWYNEVCSPGYEFSVGRGQGGTGHFTQVVWNDSVELGIGKADSKEGRMKCTYIVGRYKPLGNFFTGNEDYKKNVKQGSFNRQEYCSKIKSSFKKSSSFLSKVLRRK